MYLEQILQELKTTRDNLLKELDRHDATGGVNGLEKYAKLHAYYYGTKNEPGRNLDEVYGISDVKKLVAEIRKDVESDDFRRVFGKFLSRLGNAFRHFSKNEQSALTGLFQSGAKNFFVDALDFNIHLNGGDAFGRTRNFEVHISEEIFETLYIAHNGNSARLVVLDKTHCDARYGSLDGNAGVFESHRAAAYARH